MPDTSVGLTRHFSWDEVADREGLPFDDEHPELTTNIYKLAYKLEELRALVGHPLRITSWYRHPAHSAERDKERPGAHTTGLAVDIAVGPEDAHELVVEACALGFNGIGVSQRIGKPRFIHLDLCKPGQYPGIIRNRIFSY